MDKHDIFTESHAHALDKADPLHKLREHFIIPDKANLAAESLSSTPTGLNRDYDQAIYLCGNSLGLQPVTTRQYMEQYLATWAQKGVYGHFKNIKNTPLHLPPWVDVDEQNRDDMARIVGAKIEEVAVMQTLTANLHLLMCSFYRPTQNRHKILIEGRAFPSDHFAVESQIHFHGFDPKSSMVLLEPPSEEELTFSTEYILSVIDKHAGSLALVLLPGIQYYTGQFFDIKTITAHAQSKNITVGWDLAHAAGNVSLQLHEWNVDFAVWCTYKYLNAGPGSIGACFVHERHGQVSTAGAKDNPTFDYRPRLAGWWGSQKSSRFAMSNHFEPIPGAAGFQVSNTSVADSTAVRGSLDIFAQTSMGAIRKKSLKITGYLERLLDLLAMEQVREFGDSLFSIITPRNPDERGAQLSVKLEPGLLDSVMETLEKNGVVVDERKPDVVRIAPAPLYNSFDDVRKFMVVFRDACSVAAEKVPIEKLSNLSVADDMCCNMVKRHDTPYD